MAEDKKKSVEEFASQLRDEYEVPPGVSDGELVGRYLKANPQAISQLTTVEARRTLKPNGNAVSRYLRGVGANVAEMFSAKNLAKLGVSSSPFTDPNRSAEGTHPLIGAAEHPIETGKQMVDLPNITKDIEKGDWAHAAGRATAATIPYAATAAGMVGGKKPMTFAGFMEATDTISAPVKASLDAQYAALDEAMANQYINAQKLSAGIAHAKNVIAKVGKTPGTTAGDLSAAQDVVSRLANKVKGNKAIPWSDARQALVELRAAKQKVSAGAAKKALDEIETPLNSELGDSAKAAGNGQAWESITKDYADFSKWKRRHTEILKGKSEQQLATKATAKNSPSLRIAGSTPIRFGRTRLGKITDENSKLLQGAHDALDDLHKRIQSRPKPKPPSPTKGEAGTFSRDPRSGEQLLQSVKDMKGEGAKPAPTPAPNPAPTPLPPVSGGSQGADKPPAPAPSPEPQWPKEYQGQPQTLDKSGQGGANYTAEQLKALKDKYGIK